MRKIITAIMAALGMGVSACTNNDSIKTVDADSFEQSIQTDSVQLVDVRTAEEYAEGFIAYAINIDMRQPDFMDKAQARVRKEKPVYVYCRSGRRSMTAAEQLAAAGYEVINLKGGIMGWEAAGKPVSNK